VTSPKGRMLPSSLSRSLPFSKLPLAAKALYPLLIANADDQGRLAADPQMLKWNVCPNIDEITTTDIPHLLQAMEVQALVIVYKDDAHLVLQLSLWWEDQAAMQWAYPSQFLPPDDWHDRLRFRNQGRVITINWPNKANGAQDTPLPGLATQLSFSRSLNVAIQKALGHPLPDAAASPKEETSGTFRA